MQIFKIYLREKFGMFLAQKNTKYLGAFETNSFMHIYSNVDMSLVIWFILLQLFYVFSLELLCLGISKHE